MFLIPFGAGLETKRQPEISGSVRAWPQEVLPSWVLPQRGRAARGLLAAGQGGSRVFGMSQSPCLNPLLAGVRDTPCWLLGFNVVFGSIYFHVEGPAAGQVPFTCACTFSDEHPAQMTIPALQTRWEFYRGTLWWTSEFSGNSCPTTLSWFQLNFS